MFPTRVKGDILGTSVEVTSCELARDFIVAMAQEHRPGYICFATAHMLVEATRKDSVRDAYQNAAMICPDGVPVAWSLRLFGKDGAECVSGPQMTRLLLEAAASHELRIGFYGGRPETLDRMQSRLAEDYPGLNVSYACSPPFRDLKDEEQAGIARDIRNAEVDLLFVGLGSVKQERWMRTESGALPCVCLGVGAAFEFLSGEKVLPPDRIQRMGLAWLVRLCQEPRRLAKRNLYSPVFAWMVFRQWMAQQYRSAGMHLASDAEASSESTS